MKKSYLILSGILLIVILSAIFYFIINSAQHSGSPTIPQNQTTESMNMQEEKFETTKSSEEISQEIADHNSKDDCWISINGKIYDITSFVKKHPGGDVILQACGKDATELFFTRPMGSKTGHSKKAENMLKQYLIK